MDDSVRFLARGKGHALYLTRGGATLTLQPANGSPTQVSMRVVGAREVEPRGVGELAGRSNYALGNDSARWVREVSSFSAVEYAGILPGVDLIYHAAETRELEYDLVLAPGVEASTLEVELEGTGDVELEADGSASLGKAGAGTLVQRRPVAYQLRDDGSRDYVDASFRLSSPSRLGFTVARYDHRRALVIDPTLSYAAYIGGSKFDEFDAVAADSSGNIYAVGYTTGTLFPTRAPAQPAFGGGFADAVVVKLNAAGNDYVYATYLGGNDTDQAFGVAVDSAGSAYVTGVTYSTNFPTLGGLQPTFGGGTQDAFVTKLSANGAMLYSTFLGGSGDDLGQAIALDSVGQAHVTGSTFSTNFPRANAFQNALAGSSDGFVSKFSIAGNSLLFSTYLGGSGSEFGQGITVEPSGGAIVVGQTGSSNFPKFLPAQASFGGGQTDAYVTRFNPSGSALVYSTTLGGSGPDVATSVSQVGGTAFVAGYTSSSNFPLLGATQSSLGGGSDAFVARVRANGLDFSTYLGGSGNEQATGIAADSIGSAYVVGQTSSGNFPVASAISGQETLRGSSDGFLAAYQGATKAYATYLGGSNTDGATGITSSGNTLLIVGNTLSTDFPTTPTAAPIGSQDGFVVRLPVQTLTAAPAGPALYWLYVAAAVLGAGLLVLSRSGQASRLA